MDFKIPSFSLALLALLSACSNDDDTNTIDSATEIHIPDPQFESKLISLGIDSDGTVNEKLLKTDAAQVEYLDISSQTESDEIHDLTGIEGFTKLKRLFAIGNRLSAIDLSQNVLLDTLDLSGNDLSEIDLSQNKALIKLDLKVNDLEEVTGLSAATQLQWLNLSFNFLETYTIENPSLVHILISNNQLQTFDTSLAVALESIYARTNKIAQLDLTQNTLLETIDIGDNQLTQIELGDKPQLSYLSCFSNELTHLDVSTFEALDYLSANRNPDLWCITVGDGQSIPTLKLSEYQQTSEACEW
ncbi:leucine-rich repeat domain-containing protein [Flagellimonas sp.]|uniref:leucine-rich repeat domain-containing protein n=1 Tax=Flagellimonas sp. TaxID=2058762 RepID=UPI003B51CAF5